MSSCSATTWNCFSASEDLLPTAIRFVMADKHIIWNSNYRLTVSHNVSMRSYNYESRYQFLPMLGARSTFRQLAQPIAWNDTYIINCSGISTHMWLHISQLWRGKIIYCIWVTAYTALLSFSAGWSKCVSTPRTSIHAVKLSLDNRHGTRWTN